MARENYAFIKRQKELARKKKNEEKRQIKLEKKKANAEVGAQQQDTKEDITVA